MIGSVANGLGIQECLFENSMLIWFPITVQHGHERKQFCLMKNIIMYVNYTKIR